MLSSFLLCSKVFLAKRVLVVGLAGFSMVFAGDSHGGDSLLRLRSSREAILSFHEVVHQKEGERPRYKIQLIQTPTKQFISLSGGFDWSFAKAKAILSQLESAKDIYLYISHGNGGLVSKHRRFVRSLKEKCISDSGEKLCDLHTIIAGPCASACVGVFLSGDVRSAATEFGAELQMHRTFIRLFGKDLINVQTGEAYRRRLKRFDRVNGEVVDRFIRFESWNNKDLLAVSGEGLFIAGFADLELEPEAGRSFLDYLRVHHAIDLEYVN